MVAILDTILFKLIKMQWGDSSSGEPDTSNSSDSTSWKLSASNGHGGRPKLKKPSNVSNVEVGRCEFWVESLELRVVSLELRVEGIWQAKELLSFRELIDTIYGKE